MAKRQTIKSLQEALWQSESALVIEQEAVHKRNDKIVQLEKRLSDIAGENESLRIDKKWLQQMHSGLLQSITELLSRSR